jgi:hypothetical protein
MRRIGLAVVLAVSVLASPFAGRAQPLERQVKIGVLCAGFCPFHGPVASFRPLTTALERIGLVQGRTLAWDIGGVVNTEDLIAVDTTGMEHSPTSATGTGWEPTPWRAVQGAARDALRRAGVHG